MNDQTQEQEISFLIIIFVDKKGNMGQLNFKKPFEFHSFSEIFYCGMTRLRNTTLVVFIQYQYTAILRNKSKGQSLFKKHSKIQNFNEIFYCGMIRLRNMNLDVFMQCQHTRTTLINKNIGQSLLKKYSKFQKFDEILCCGMTKYKNRFKNKKCRTKLF